MSMNKANKMFYVIMFFCLIVLGGMLWFLFAPDTHSSAVESRPAETILDVSIDDLTPEELRQMGLEGDTKDDTVRTLIGKTKDNNRKLAQVLRQNEQLLKENRRLKSDPRNVDLQIAEAVKAEREAFANEIDALKTQFMSMAAQVSNASNVNTMTTDIPVGIGLSSEDTLKDEKPSLSDEMQWINPSDQVPLDSSGKPLKGNNTGIPSSFGFPNDFSHNSSVDEPHLIEEVKQKLAPKIPFYTIPENSTLMGAVSMTALLGRIPINNNVSDPYPFKVIIGADNLMANGIELPDIQQAIVSGTATGDWTLSCVRGKITSLSFIFNDGRIVSSNDSDSDNKDIGWLSDDSGIPCVPGERKTNAPEYLSTNFLLAGASAAAQGLSASQTTSVVENGSIASAVTGNNGKFILGQALGSGLKETADWFKERYGQMFDAVYVPPGQKVAIHINQQIEIDYNPAARKVKYSHNAHARQSLD
ncbi:TIGR03752 family integrating conjugative element protein [Phocoenobacter skyensis]|uniref:TIGR03752 family integrating conjugative element protein n=1 Tax=Phocoenobacter skyensis TaxID=97481 RepID=UPI00277905AA|nr:TIGR03752 family integrating conjugative element protein [Pasteurella skyensis]MDP8185321.1 TIGR03752 family integrating conjugative element protein [Pasteurella skyensis]